MTTDVITQNTTVQYGGSVDNQRTGVSDTHLRQTDPTINQHVNFNGGILEVTKYGGNDHNHTIIRFDGLTNIPTNAIVSFSEIRVYQESVGGAGSYSVDLREILQDWIEDSATWDTFNGTAGTGDWDTGGALGAATDRESAPESTTPIGTALQYYGLPCTALVQAMVAAGTPLDAHLERNDVGEDNTSKTLTSSEGTDSQRPELVVIWALPASGISGTISSTLAGFNQGLDGNAVSNISGTIGSVLQGFNQGLLATETSNISATIGSTLAGFNQGLEGNVTFTSIVGTANSTIKGFNQGLLGGAKSNISGVMSSTLKSFNQGLEGNVTFTSISSVIGSVLKSFNQGLEGGAESQITGAIGSTLKGFNQGLSGNVVTPGVVQVTVSSVLKGFNQGLDGNVVSDISGIISSVLQSFNQGLLGGVTSPLKSGTIGSVLKSFNQGLLGTSKSDISAVIGSVLQSFNQGLLGNVDTPVIGLTFRQAILDASSLPQGATLREHLKNLVGSGSGTPIFINGFNIIVEDEVVKVKIEDNDILVAIEDNEVAVVIENDVQVIIEDDTVVSSIDDEINITIGCD